MHLVRSRCTAQTTEWRRAERVDTPQRMQMHRGRTMGPNPTLTIFLVERGCTRYTSIFYRSGESPAVPTRCISRRQTFKGEENKGATRLLARRNVSHSPQHAHVESIRGPFGPEVVPAHERPNEARGRKQIQTLAARECFDFGARVIGDKLMRGPDERARSNACKGSLRRIL